LFERKIINNVVIKPSPKWLKEALNSVGVKSINNVVDISNYVMLETGQPLHFYDLDKIPGREITVVTGLDEDYVALDGISYHIEPQDIMITNQGNAIGIAGIMGGDDSKIDENTHGIIIEAATFDSVCIRNTARRLGLDTEAATRFQKGIDPAGGHKAVERSVQLLIELADASGIEETVLWGSNEVKEIHIDASVKSINALLGTGFTEEQMIDTFRRLDFHPVKINEDTINVTVPTYRTDIRVWQDLAEEVIRLLGYDHIVSTLPLMPTIQGGLSEEGKKKRKLQSILVGNGLHEIITYSLVSMKKIEQGILNIGKPVEIANPLSDERRYLHTSLLPSMLETASYNTARGNTEYGLFEISHVYDDENRDEQHLGIILSENHTVSSWQHVTEKNDFYAMKGLVLTILDQLGYSENRIACVPVEGDAGLLHRYQNAVVLINRVPVGKIGVIDARVQKQFDLDRCVLAEINLTAVYAQKPGKVKFTAVPRYPSVSYDISMIIGRDVTAQMLKDTVKKAGGNLLKNVDVIDVYQGKNIPDDKQSITVSMLFQSDERTLTDEDIRPLYNEAVKQLIGKHGAVIRDS
ncbi:MAG: phenylalanine--tRNA ligase subunit beta, partial [Erysipelotrichaceae bacterium]|nr:phenylalanine--tRNA ligase subunit beta [Erysipelotrichaceae bacterium]